MIETEGDGRAEAWLAAISGALLDAGTPDGDVSTYADRVRSISAECQQLKKDNVKLCEIIAKCQQIIDDYNVRQRG